ncbi:high affinity copper uptake protein 1 [Nilaparvata lugens]|uniref:high affinity copper uptake protein 1 n=1 Tax=Nilaparvata lugens TaxID=108931 RepID=UPI00193DC85F|nr:high affinity copper uptake protein 1 [Nilaparvata lugens]
MHESFWFGFKLDDLLFKGLNITSESGIINACVLILLAAALFEGLKLLQMKVNLNILSISSLNFNLPCFNDESELLQENGVTTKKSIEIWWFLLEVGMYAGQVLLGYILMLLVMTYNVYVMIAVIGGAGIGYAMFGAQVARNRIKMTQLKIPCQQCTQFLRSASAASTLLENESLATTPGDQSGASTSMPAETNRNETNIDVHTSHTATSS